MPSMSRDACRAAAELATEGDGRGPSTVFSVSVAVGGISGYM